MADGIVVDDVAVRNESGGLPMIAAAAVDSSTWPFGSA